MEHRCVLLSASMYGTASHVFLIPGAILCISSY